MTTVVAFHAHPDDEVLLTGGTLARLAAEGHRVVIVLACSGDMKGATGTNNPRLQELAARPRQGARGWRPRGGTHRDPGAGGDGSPRAGGLGARPDAAAAAGGPLRPAGVPPGVQPALRDHAPDGCAQAHGTQTRGARGAPVPLEFRRQVGAPGQGDDCDAGAGLRAAVRPRVVRRAGGDRDRGQPPRSPARRRGAGGRPGRPWRGWRKAEPALAGLAEGRASRGGHGERPS